MQLSWKVLYWFTLGGDEAYILNSLISFWNQLKPSLGLFSKVTGYFDYCQG